MIKKSIGSLVAVSALGIGLFSTQAFAAQTDNSSLNQNQTASGWASFYQFQTKTVKSTAGQVGSSGGSGQGQAVVASGSQVQSGTSNGAGTAEASQSQDTVIDASQTGGTGTQTTQVGGSSNQNTSTTSAGYSVQAQRSTAVTFQFEGSIDGGLSMQKQSTQGHTYQFSSSVPKP